MLVKLEKDVVSGVLALVVMKTVSRHGGSGKYRDEAVEEEFYHERRFYREAFIEGLGKRKSLEV
jgi:hypothetical protein